jgi:hypothetical protein
MDGFDPNYNTRFATMSYKPLVRRRALTHSSLTFREKDVDHI